MAFTVDQADIGHDARASSTSSTITTTAAVAAGALVVVLIGRFNSASPSSTLSSGVGSALALTQAHTGTNGSYRISLFYAWAPAGLASSSSLIVTSSTSGNNDFTAVAASYLGGDSAVSPIAVNATGGATAAWASGTVTAASGNLLVGGAAGDGTLRTSTPTGPAVERIDFNSLSSGGSATLVDKLSVAGSTSLAGTWSGTLTHVAIAVAFQAAAGGATTYPQRNVFLPQWAVTRAATR